MIDKPTLAFFIPSMSDGGAERITLNLVNNIASRYDVNVHLVLAKAKGPFLSQVSPNVQIIDLKSKHTRNSLLNLVRYISEYKPAAITSALSHANIVTLLANLLCRQHAPRVVVTLHINLSASQKEPTNTRARLVPFFIKRTYKWADEIVGVSHGVADDLAERIGIKRTRIKVIYNPVITPDLKQKATELPNHRWFDGNHAPVVLAAGRLGKQKNFGLLIDAFNEIKDQTNANLLILGEGEQHEILQAKINQYGMQSRIELAGFVANPYAYMSQTNVFVMSSIYEGLPTVLIEAMYCGATLVSTDCPSGPREILQGGKLGELVPMNDAQQLGIALIKSLSTPKTSQMNEAWQQFEVDAVADEYVRTMMGPLNVSKRDKQVK